VRLFHGSEDKDVPPAWAAKIEKALMSEDVTVTMVEGGDHRLSSPADLARYGAAILELA
jgi:dipeptidyl aminopeptidase/acylaminoacyl peptidase